MIKRERLKEKEKDTIVIFFSIDSTILSSVILLE